MITDNGATALRRYWAGYQSSIADTMFIGLSNGATKLEWARFPISMIGTDVDAGQIVFKVESQAPSAGSVHEVGLIQGANGISSDVVISTFNSTGESWSGDYAFTTANSRLGEGLVVAATKTATLYLNYLDLSSVKPTENLTLAAFATAAGSVNVTIVFANSTSVQYTFTLAQGYNIVTLAKSAGVVTGAVDFTQAVSLSVTPTKDVTVDMLKYVVAPVEETLIARTVLATPFVAGTSLPLEIEYPLAIRVVNA